VDASADEVVAVAMDALEARLEIGEAWQRSTASGLSSIALGAISPRLA
jgi:hypothetical protein